MFRGGRLYNPYKILGVSSLSTKEEIKEVYKKLCKKYHPDNLETGDTSKFQEIVKAWKFIDEHHVDNGSKSFKHMWKHKTLFSIYKEE